jgi:F-type H+-transporting ATPase subunit a
VIRTDFGTHPTIDLGCGTLCTFNYDSLISSAVAIAATLGLAFWLRSQFRDGAPGPAQAIFELGYDAVRSLVNDIVAVDAVFIIPLAMTLFLYILVGNWLEILPLGFFPILHGANADVNQTLAMSLIVIIVVQWYSFRVLGVWGYLKRYTRPFELPLVARALFVPLNIIEEITKPVTLALRLFGNIFAGAVMIALIAGFGVFVFPKIGFLDLSKLGTVPGTVLGSLLLVLWKAFDVLFIGLLQAFIFMLLTIIYFGAAREGIEHQHQSQQVHQ